MYLPNISLVCASIPGRAEKKNPIIGNSKNSSGCMIYDRGFLLFGRAGRLTASITNTTIIEIRDRVRSVEVT